MTDANGNKKPGREAKYKLDLAAFESNDGEVRTVQLSKKGDDGKTYSVETKEVTVIDLNQALAILSGNEEHLFELFTARVINPMLQAGARQKLAVLAQGPTKAILDQIATLVDGGAFDEAEATELVVARYKAKGLVSEDFVLSK
jgi:hypothetical protein